MSDRTRALPLPSTILHNAVELRRAYIRLLGKKAAKAVSNRVRLVHQWIVSHIGPNRPAES